MFTYQYIDLRMGVSLLLSSCTCEDNCLLAGALGYQVRDEAALYEVCAANDPAKSPQACDYLIGQSAVSRHQ